jgi:nucleotide-binding universal stress UspA family protein
LKFLVCQECEKGNLDSRVLDAALKNVKGMGGKLIIANSQMMEDRFHAKEIDAVKKCLDAARQKAESMGVTCETHLSVRGMPPGEDFLKLAKEYGVDEIYIGIKKRSKLGKLLIGSTTQYLLPKTDIPVVAVK